MKKRKVDNASEAIRLYKAVARYVERSGGSVLIAGGIQIQQWPGKRKGVFSVSVECVGRLPDFVNPTRTGTKE